MNAEVRRRWVTALRSGDYAQGTSRLCTITSTGEREYCCLGVLCALAAEDGIVTSRDEPGHFRVVYVSNDDRPVDPSHLPVAVRDWAGLASVDPVVDVDVDAEGVEVRWSLSFVNDRGTSFADVARLIEDQL